MRRLTRAEIEAGGAAMPQIMRYHDCLCGQKLESIDPLEAEGEYPGCDLLVFSHGSVLSPRYDDEGNPGDAEWQVADPDGYLTPRLRLRDLIGLPVTGIGYLHDPDEGQRRVIPFVEIAGTSLLCCMTDQGGGVIAHDRPADRSYDLFCQFTPKL